MSLMRWRCFLELGKTTKHPSRNACDCRSVWTTLTGNKSPKSTYLPATIWLIVFARIGKKPGPTTKGCWSSGPEGKLATKELSLNGTGTEVPAVIEVLNISECGVANVATKEGTVKLGLLWDDEGESIGCCSWKRPPEAKNVAVCWDKLGDWAGTPQEVDGDATQAELPSEAHTHCSR